MAACLHDAPRTWKKPFEGTFPYPTSNTPTPDKPPYALELRFILLVHEASERLVGLTLRSAARAGSYCEGRKEHRG